MLGPKDKGLPDPKKEPLAYLKVFFNDEGIKGLVEFPQGGYVGTNAIGANLLNAMGTKAEKSKKTIENRLVVLVQGAGASGDFRKSLQSEPNEKTDERIKERCLAIAEKDVTIQDARAEHIQFLENFPGIHIAAYSYLAKLKGADAGPLLKDIATKLDGQSESLLKAKTTMAEGEVKDFTRSTAVSEMYDNSTSVKAATQKIKDEAASIKNMPDHSKALPLKKIPESGQAIMEPQLSREHNHNAMKFANTVKTAVVKEQTKLDVKSFEHFFDVKPVKLEGGDNPLLLKGAPPVTFSAPRTANSNNNGNSGLSLRQQAQAEAQAKAPQPSAPENKDPPRSPRNNQ